MKHDAIKNNVNLTAKNVCFLFVYRSARCTRHASSFTIHILKLNFFENI